MWRTPFFLLLSFLAGAAGGNAIPHFVRGITHEKYLTVFGNDPITNVVVGWLGLVLTGLLAYAAGLGRPSRPKLAAFAIGVLAMGLFHAGPGAFGKDEPAPWAR